MINLMDGGIQHSNVFRHMPLFDEIYYEGLLDGKVRRYRATREGQPCRILALNVIRKDEQILWDALEDLIKRCTQTSAQGVRGVYSFDFLTMDIHKEIKTFKPNELAETIINHTRVLTPGGTRLVRYSTCFGLLQKLGIESWGKIAVKTAVEVFKDKPVFLDILIKQLIKNFDFSNDPGILLLNDLSQNPLFEPDNPQQQERLTQVIESQIPKSIEFVPEVYIQDKNGMRELLSGSVLQ